MKNILELACDQDFLNERIDANLAFRFASIPLEVGLEVPRPAIWTSGKNSSGYFDENGRKRILVEDEDLDTCFFSLMISFEECDDRNNHTPFSLPKGFYCGEFLDLDPRNIQDFLFFQRRYGVVYGARERKPVFTDVKERLRPEPDHNVFAGVNGELFAEQLKGIRSSEALFDEVPDEEMCDKFELLKLSAVSFREAIAAVEDAQWAIRATTRVLRKDLPSMTRKEAAEAKWASEYVTKFLPKAFPSLELVVADNQKRTCDLITAVFVQLARGLLNNNAYRLCANPECSRLFTPRDMGRRLDSCYCSSECQERAKRLRHDAKHSNDNS